MSALVLTTRRIIQPGPPCAERVAVAVAPRPRRALVWLPEGQTLYSALVGAFARFNARSGALQLLGGDLSAAAYHVPIQAPDSLRAADYGPAIELESGVRVIRATGSYGEDLSGRPLLHIHGALAEPSGRGHGGHIAPDRCVVGPAGIRALLLLTVGFKQIIDRETRFSLFFPVAEVVTHAAVNHSRDQHWSRRERSLGTQ